MPLAIQLNERRPTGSLAPSHDAKLQRPSENGGRIEKLQKLLSRNLRDKTQWGRVMPQYHRINPILKDVVESCPVPILVKNYLATRMEKLLFAKKAAKS